MNLDDQVHNYGIPTRGDTLAEQVYRQLSSAILSGSLMPKERINLKKISKDSRVSVTPVREAALRLVADDILEIAENNVIQVPERTEAEIDEIFNIRRILEGDMAQAAAGFLSENDIDSLRDTQDKFLAALGESDYRLVLYYNSVFHFTIYERAGLPVRLKIAKSLWLRIGPTLRYMYPILHRNRTEHRRHEDIINAAVDRDPDALRRAVQDDLNSSQLALKQYLREYPDIAQDRMGDGR